MGVDGTGSWGTGDITGCCDCCCGCWGCYCLSCQEGCGGSPS